MVLLAVVSDCSEKAEEARLTHFEIYCRRARVSASCSSEMRASQINGCAYCIDMHSKDARSAGETEQRLYGSAYGDQPVWPGPARF